MSAEQEHYIMFVLIPAIIGVAALISFIYKKLQGDR